MKYSAGLLVVIAIGAALLVAAADAAPRQFCSPNGDVCIGPLDCCSGQCVNAVCCDELLGTCPFDYPYYPWRRSQVTIATTDKPDFEVATETTTTQEPTTPNSV
ncbi:uncharacterized protein LOC144167205 [Haemaphysalis longicornis]